MAVGNFLDDIYDVAKGVVPPYSHNESWHLETSDKGDRFGALMTAEHYRGDPEIRDISDFPVDDRPDQRLYFVFGARISDEPAGRLEGALIRALHNAHLSFSAQWTSSTEYVITLARLPEYQSNEVSTGVIHAMLNNLSNPSTVDKFVVRLRSVEAPDQDLLVWHSGK